MAVSNSTFKNNRAKSQGGAIYGAYNFEYLIVDNCIFENNNATSGGAISAYCGGDISVFNSKFNNNTENVIYDRQINSKYLYLYLKNNIFDVENPVTVKDKVIIVDLNTNDRISGVNIDMNWGDDKNYTVTLTDSDANPIQNTEITITFTNYFNTTIFKPITNQNGQAVISLKNFKPGKYNVTAIFSGDTTFDKLNTTNKVNIKSSQSFNLIFEPDYVKLAEGESYIARAYLYDEYFEPTNELNKRQFL